MSESWDDFEYRQIDYGGNRETCLLDSIERLGVEFRAYRTTRNGRLSPRGKQVLIVCMACGRSLYEWHGEAFSSWPYNGDIGLHAQSCTGRI